MSTSRSDVCHKCDETRGAIRDNGLICWDGYDELGRHRFAGNTLCGAPAHYGGLSAARKYSSQPLGRMWHCNRRVAAEGERCYQHRQRDEVATR